MPGVGKHGVVEQGELRLSSATATEYVTGRRPIVRTSDRIGRPMLLTLAVTTLHPRPRLVRRVLRSALVLASFVTPLAAQEAEPERPRTVVGNFVSGEFTYWDFGGTPSPWRLASVAVERRGRWGSALLRFNNASRFGLTGSQLEFDAYPRLGKSAYLYLNAGTSGSAVFPENRLGAEYFLSLPEAWEASLGFRRLAFSGTTVVLLTGAVGRYTGDYWISLRPFVRSSNGITSSSLSVTARKYDKDADNYVGLRGTYGRAPTDQVSPDAIGRTESYAFNVHGSRSLAARVIATWAVGRESEQLSPTNTRRSWTATLGVKAGF